MCEAHRRQASMAQKNRRAQKRLTLIAKDVCSEPDRETSTQEDRNEDVAGDACSLQLQGAMCKHPSHCTNERSIKKNGGRHWLCEQHRQLQNAEQRQRYQRQEKYSSARMNSDERELKSDVISDPSANCLDAPSAIRQEPEGEHAINASDSTASPGDLATKSTSGSTNTGPLCGHRSACQRPRAVKKNGELHWLCELHREQQNAIQRRRRQRQAAARMPATRTPRTSPGESSTYRANPRPTANVPVVGSGLLLGPPVEYSSSASIPDSIVCVLKAQREEVRRRIEADALFLERVDEICAEHLRTRLE